MRVLIFVALLTFCEGFFFYVKQGPPRCFIEEVPEDTTIVVSYTVPDRTPEAGTMIEVKDPSGRVVKKQDCDVEGKFVYTTAVGGEHQFCMGVNTKTKKAKEMRATLTLTMGESATDYEALATKKHLDEVGVRVVKVTDMVSGILNELEFIKEREAQFREMTDEANSRVVYWSVFQIVVVVVSCLWQVKHLQSFFHAKKLV